MAPKTHSGSGHTRRTRPESGHPVGADPRRHAGEDPRPPINLPAQLTSFIGRQAELTTLTALLEDTRLLTLTGSGGCGKTRLAVELASQTGPAYSDGVWWVDLAPLTDPDLVPNAVANVLGLQEVPFQDFAERISTGLSGNSLILVFDNCEHLIGSCADLVDRLLRDCAAIKIIATSREPLGVAGETVWRVPSLTFPGHDGTEDLELLQRYDAFRLFLERAVKARPNLRLDADNADAVADICRRLDGIPLAIELAAARTGLLSPSEIASGLEDRFRLLAGGARTAIARQQTLLASVEWSYRLLDDTERALLRKLAVFAGSFTLDAAEAVCGDETTTPEVLDLLGALIDKSLLQIEEPWSPTRYRMLETIRQYAGQKLLDSDEMPALRDRHLDHYVSVAEAARAELEEGSHALETLDLLDLELDNLRASMEWAGHTEPIKGQRIARALWGYWYSRGLFSEGTKRCLEAASADQTSPVWRARVLAGASVLAATTLDGVRSIALADQALHLARESGDPVALVEALYAQGPAHLNSDPEVARAPIEEAMVLAGRMEHPFWLMRSTFVLGAIECASGNLDAGRHHLGEAMRLAAASGIRVGRLLTLWWSAAAALDQGDLDDAESLAAQAVEESLQLHNIHYECLASQVGAMAAVLKGNYGKAESILREVRRLTSSHPHPVVSAISPLPEQMLKYATGDLEGGGDALQSTAQFFQAIGAGRISAWVLALQADFKRARGELEEARALAGAALEEARSSKNPVAMGRAALSMAGVLRAAGDLDPAEDAVHEALRNLEQAGAKRDIAAALDVLGGIACLQESWQESVRLLAAAETLRKAAGMKRCEPERRLFEDDMARARAHLDEDLVAQAWEEGAAMSTQEALAYAVRGRGERKRPSSGWKSLTPAELDVVRLVAQGLTNPQIGKRLFISSGTVKNHLSHVFAKLGMSTRAELAAEAVRRQLEEV